jgi:aminoglycoside phosphotransferase (APT) family kinase protein
METLLRCCGLAYRSSAMTDPTRERLRDWIAARKGATDVEVSPIESPSNTGYSHQTMLFDASWNSNGVRHSERLVAKLLRPEHDVFLEPDFAAEYKVMEALEGTDVPLAPCLGYEEDPAWLGAPFYVIGRVDGVIPPDNPPYTFGGWLLEAAPKEQEHIWWSGLEAMTHVHAIDPDSLGLGFLDRAKYGTRGFAQELGYYKAYVAWAGGGHPSLDAGLDWLEANRPKEEQLGLCWGDARIANQIFRDGRCVAVLDWEMATIADPEMDLAWYCYFDRLFSEGLGQPRLPGIPGAAETIARWEETTGRTASHQDFYETYAAFRFAAIFVRLMHLMAGAAALGTDNFATQSLEKILAERR